jgi:DtxR family transcriptional regulator, Mn-dependent transcriptional regulator
MKKNELTATQEDYIEIIYRMTQAQPGALVRVTDIAAQLGTKLPTVTRTVRRLTALGLLEHTHRQGVALSSTGRKMASDILHRHEDVVRFFIDVLGLSKNEAELDACQIEHGMSAKTAQRLHEFLEYFNTLSDEQQQIILRFREEGIVREQQFKNLARHKAQGWRS